MIKKRELLNLGIDTAEALSIAKDVLKSASQNGIKKNQAREMLIDIIECPESFRDDPLFGPLAAELAGASQEERESYKFNDSLTFARWGDGIDTEALEQMSNACRLPVSVAGALMPDAHLGYGLPIGGVLATEESVIPYAVGVDIGCRMMVSVTDLDVKLFEKNPSTFDRALENFTKFGIGSKWRDKREHSVMDEDWNQTRFLSGLKNLAWSQLGTSGSGNHFVEFGIMELLEEVDGVAPGSYVTLVSHSGSRGAGARTASHYSELAQKMHRGLPRELRHLAWLPMDSEEGTEYWVAMQLMGKYASANHHVIHKDVLRAVRARTRLVVENHHNFAWEEVHQGKQVIVHRKGATPAGKGVRGFIPGTMIHPGFLVEGKGHEASLASCAHGAGRAMSRKKAKNTTTRHEVERVAKDAKVRVLSCGLDESPHAYKNIETVMRSQKDLVHILGRFQPRVVKMAPEGERPED